MQTTLFNDVESRLATRNLKAGTAVFQVISQQGSMGDQNDIAPNDAYGACGVIGAGGSLALAAPRLDPVKAFDTDADGTLDLAEVKKAASTLFAKLDRDHDGTLDKRELAGRLSAKELVAADPDHDGTLTLDEYLAVVEQRFKAADPDKEGTIDAKELKSRAGRALSQLLQ